MYRDLFVQCSFLVLSLSYSHKVELTVGLNNYYLRQLTSYVDNCSFCISCQSYVQLETQQTLS